MSAVATSDFKAKETYEYFTPLTAVIVVMACSLANFMDILDTTIVNVALFHIAGAMSISTGESIWVVTSYTITLAIMTPITGWLSRRFGMANVFVISATIFGICSITNGLAPNFICLVLSRGIQGLASGPLGAVALGLMGEVVLPKNRQKVTVLWGMTVLVAPALGPPIGGWLTDHYSWPIIFYINIPMALISIAVVGLALLKYDKPKYESVDFIGIILIFIAVIPLQVILDKGKDLDWFESPLIVILTVICIVGFIFLFAWELMYEKPILNLKLFLNKNFTMSTIMMSLGYGCFFGTVVLLPTILQQSLGYNATWSGSASSVFGMCAFVSLPLAGFLMNKGVDGRILLTVGFLGLGGMFIYRARFYIGMDFGSITHPYAIQGLFMPFFFPPLMNMISKEFKGHEMVEATGISGFCRSVFGSFGASVSATLKDNRTAFHFERFKEYITKHSDAYMSESTKLGHSFSTEQVFSVITHKFLGQAVIMGANDVFWLCGIIMIGLVPIIWTMKYQNLAGVQPGH